MTDSTDTWDMKPGFKLRRYEGGGYFVAIDRYDDDLPMMGDGFLGIDFGPDTSREKAGEIVDLLNEHVEYITYTGQPKVGWRVGRSGQQKAAG